MTRATRSPLIEPDVRISRIRLSQQLSPAGMHGVLARAAWPGGQPQPRREHGLA